MNSFFQTDTFADWLSALKDAKTKARVLERLKAAELGNFGDCSPVGGGISEMRLRFGAAPRKNHAIHGVTRDAAIVAQDTGYIFGKKADTFTGCLPAAIRVHKNAILHRQEFYAVKLKR